MSESVKVAVILPSRGLIFSQTADEILQNVKGIPHRFYFSHRQPIPDCFEEPTERALKDKDITHLWFCEDDMILPPDVLDKMLKTDLAVVTCNYPTTARGDSSILTVKNRIVYGGTGCTLVKRAVFDELPKPYFRDDIAWIPKNKGTFIRFMAIKRPTKGYGFHDVNFFMNLYMRDIHVHKLNITLGQRKLKALGKAGTNNGAHQIEEWTKCQPDRYETLIKNLPEEPSGELVEIITHTGNQMAHPDHAKKLIKAGLAKKAPHRPVVLDTSNL